MADAARRRIAIACQGGGSHTAFTAGVLKTVLRDERFEVVGLSGTSGGAVCALLAWHGLVQGDVGLAVDGLDAFWEANAASDPWDMALNSWMVGTSRLEGTVTLPSLNPYLYPPWAAERLRRLVVGLVPEADMSRTTARPLLLVGAVEVLSGKFHVFSSARGEISSDAILASAAVPNLFRAAYVDGQAYWDGLFSQNPPVDDLPDQPEVKPDELWVVRINPVTTRREPMTVPDILDRRNELAGNLSLEQELRFINRINRFLKEGAFKKDTKYRPVAVKFIELDRGGLDVSSKLNRSRSFLHGLIRHGEEQAGDFLAAA